MEEQPVQGELSAKRAGRQMAALRAAREDGALEVLSEFVPQIVASIQRRQALLPKLDALIGECIAARDTSALKDIAPLTKALLDEDKRILDRVLGSAVQRSKAEIKSEVAVTHVNLRDLVRGGQVVVDAEVVGE